MKVKGVVKIDVRDVHTNELKRTYMRENTTTSMAFESMMLQDPNKVTTDATNYDLIIGFYDRLADYVGMQTSEQGGLDGFWSKATDEIQTPFTYFRAANPPYLECVMRYQAPSEEASNSDRLDIVSIVRASNITTVTLGTTNEHYWHKYKNGEIVTIDGVNEAGFNGPTNPINVINKTSFSYSDPGPDETGTFIAGAAYIFRCIRWVGIIKDSGTANYTFSSYSKTFASTNRAVAYVRFDPFCEQGKNEVLDVTYRLFFYNELTPTKTTVGQPRDKALVALERFYGRINVVDAPSYDQLSTEERVYLDQHPIHQYDHFKTGGTATNQGMNFGGCAIPQNLGIVYTLTYPDQQYYYKDVLNARPIFTVSDAGTFGHTARSSGTSITGTSYYRMINQDIRDGPNRWKFAFTLPAQCELNGYVMPAFGIGASRTVISWSSEVINPVLPSQGIVGGSDLTTSFSPIQVIHNHNASAIEPFLDVDFLGAGQSTPVANGAGWTDRLNEKWMRVQYTDSGDVGTSRYVYYERNLYGGFRCPPTGISGFYEPVYQGAVKPCHYWFSGDSVNTNAVFVRSYNCENIVDYDDDYIIKHDLTGILLQNLMTGEYVTFGPETSPSLPGSDIHMVAVDDSKNIWVADRASGLYRVQDAFGTPTITKMTEATNSLPVGANTAVYTVAWGHNNRIYALCEGGLAYTDAPGAVTPTFTTDASFSYTGITDSNWSNVWYHEMDKRHPDHRMALLYRLGTDEPGDARVCWYDPKTRGVGTPTATTGPADSEVATAVIGRTSEFENHFYEADPDYLFKLFNYNRLHSNRLKCFHNGLWIMSDSSAGDGGVTTRTYYTYSWTKFGTNQRGYQYSTGRAGAPDLSNAFFSIYPYSTTTNDHRYWTAVEGHQQGREFDNKIYLYDYYGIPMSGGYVDASGSGNYGYSLHSIINMDKAFSQSSATWTLSSFNRANGLDRGPLFLWSNGERIANVAIKHIRPNRNKFLMGQWDGSAQTFDGEAETIDPNFASRPYNYYTMNPVFIDLQCGIQDDNDRENTWMDGSPANNSTPYDGHANYPFSPLREVMWNNYRWNNTLSQWENYYHVPATDAVAGNNAPRHNFEVEDHFFTGRSMIDASLVFNNDKFSNEATFAFRCRANNWATTSEGRAIFDTFTTARKKQQQQHYDKGVCLFEVNEPQGNNRIKLLWSNENYDGGNMYLFVNDGTANQMLSTTGYANIQPGQWCRVVVTANTSGVALYINGQGPVGGAISPTFPTDFSNANNNMKFYIGTNNIFSEYSVDDVDERVMPFQFFRGDIINAQVWSRAWGSSDVSADWTDANGNNTPTNTANLEHRWILTEGADSLNNTETKATHGGFEALNDGLTIRFPEDATTPSDSYLASEYHTFGVCEGLLKDNAMSFTWEGKVHSSPMDTMFSTFTNPHNGNTTIVTDGDTTIFDRVYWDYALMGLQNATTLSTGQAFALPGRMTSLSNDNNGYGGVASVMNSGTGDFVFEAKPGLDLMTSDGWSGASGFNSRVAIMKIRPVSQSGTYSLNSTTSDYAICMYDYFNMTNGNPGADLDDASGVARVFENQSSYSLGVELANTTFVVGDTLSIERISGTMTYKKNGVTFATGATGVTGEYQYCLYPKFITGYPFLDVKATQKIPQYSMYIGSNNASTSSNTAGRFHDWFVSTEQENITSNYSIFANGVSITPQVLDGLPGNSSTLGNQNNWPLPANGFCYVVPWAGLLLFNSGQALSNVSGTCTVIYQQ